MANISKIKLNDVVYQIHDSNAAHLDNGKVPSSQLPSYVDDVIEGYLIDSSFYEDIAATIEITGESGKIYIDLETGKTYRWSGSAFSVVSETLALGETASTAYYGDKGKAAYDHAIQKGSAFTQGLYKITTNEEGHIVAAVAVTKQDILDLDISETEWGYFSDLIPTI